MHWAKLLFGTIWAPLFMRLRSTLMPRDCVERATRLATGSPALGPLKSVALCKRCACVASTWKSIEAGLDSIRDAIALKHSPDTLAEMLEPSIC